MDKDNLDIKKFLGNLTTETLHGAGAETLQQLISALCLTAVGLFLAFIGLLGLVFKLGRLVRFSLLFALRPIVLLFAPGKIGAKVVFGVTDK
jgi:hypothetical protein